MSELYELSSAGESFESIFQDFPEFFAAEGIYQHSPDSTWSKATLEIQPMQTFVRPKRSIDQGTSLFFAPKGIKRQSSDSSSSGMAIDISFVQPPAQQELFEQDISSFLAPNGTSSQSSDSGSRATLDILPTKNSVRPKRSIEQGTSPFFAPKGTNRQSSDSSSSKTVVEIPSVQPPAHLQKTFEQGASPFLESKRASCQQSDSSWSRATSDIPSAQTSVRSQHSIEEDISLFSPPEIALRTQTIGIIRTAERPRLITIRRQPKPIESGDTPSPLLKSESAPVSQRSAEGQRHVQKDTLPALGPKKPSRVRPRKVMKSIKKRLSRIFLVNRIKSFIDLRKPKCLPGCNGGGGGDFYLGPEEGGSYGGTGSATLSFSDLSYDSPSPPCGASAGRSENGSWAGEEEDSNLTVIVRPELTSESFGQLRLFSAPCTPISQRQPATTHQLVRSSGCANLRLSATSSIPSLPSNSSVFGATNTTVDSIGSESGSDSGFDSE